MSWGALALAVGLCLTLALVWAVMAPATVLFLESASVIEVSSERAPGAHAVLAELATVAGIPQPRLFVAQRRHPIGAALCLNPRGVVAISEAAFDALSSAEFRGLLALLVAALAVSAVRPRIPWRERWLATDRLAATLTGPQTVVAALSALMRHESKVSASQEMPLTRLVWAAATRLKGGLPSVFSNRSTITARVALLTSK